MKKTAVINSQLSAAIAGMGHMDKLAIGDAGMPVPLNTQKIDLAVSKQTPSFMEVLNNVLQELEVQEIILAEEIKKQNPEMLKQIEAALPGIPVTFIPHDDVKKDLNNTHAFVRTGEMTPYANIILVSGVTF